MKDYHINVLYSDEVKCYVADIPDLKDCSALGPTPGKAVREVQIEKTARPKAANAAGKHIPKLRYRPAIYQTVR